MASGKVETIEYDSKTVGVKRKMVIDTPLGYMPDRRYPVFYLLPVPTNIFDRGEFETYGRFDNELLRDVIPVIGESGSATGAD